MWGILNNSLRRADGRKRAGISQTRSPLYLKLLVTSRSNWSHFFSSSSRSSISAAVWSTENKPLCRCLSWSALFWCSTVKATTFINPKATKVDGKMSKKRQTPSAIKISRVPKNWPLCSLFHFFFSIIRSSDFSSKQTLYYCLHTTDDLLTHW